jgi:hypothetical protein
VIPIAQLLGRQVRRQPGHACLVHEDMSHGHVPLAVCSELGPHLGQTQVKVEPAGRNEGMHERAHDALGGRTGEEQEELIGSGKGDLPLAARLLEPATRRQAKTCSSDRASI